MVLRIGGNSGFIDFWTLSMYSIPKNTKNRTIREMVMFPSSGEEEGGTYSVWSVGKKTERDPVSEKLYSLEYRMVNKFQTSINPDCHTYRQNPLEST
jgi:hypothetical protein